MKAWIMVATAAVGAVLLAAPFAANAQAPANGEAVFNARCKSCHEPAIDRAPNRTALSTYQPAQVLQALNGGAMTPMAQGLSDADKAAVAAFLTTAQLPTEAHPQPGGARAVPIASRGVDVMCATNPPIHTTPSDWASVGLDANSRRFQPNPGLKAADVPRLKVKWAFAMTGGSMPTVVGDWLFITNRSGKFYALDAKTGCVHWVLDSVSSRTTPMVVKSVISPSGWATFVGERTRVVRAIDAQTGKEIWRSAQLEANPVAGITGAPVVGGDQLFVPITSSEEPAARQLTYPCCSFRGSLVALDLATGKTQWKTLVITEPLHPTHKNSAGVMMQGPAGGAIWSAPTVDAKRGVVYVATGDSYTDEPTKGDDAIDAIEMKTGKIRWSTQVTEKDNFIMGCENHSNLPNCPTPVGPDYDFGASPILFTLPSGKQIVLSGQKSGIAYGMDPDSGKLLWKTAVGSGSALGGIEWGMAADGKRLYVAVSDIVNLFGEVPGAAPVTDDKMGPPKPGLYALNPATGKFLWSTPAPKADCHYAGDRSRDYAKGACIRAQSAAPSAMPGAVFSGTTDGWFRAYDPATGKIVWAFSTTAQTYDTVNQVKSQPGGSIDGMGPAIAGGMVYTMSGFLGASNTGGNPMNVLLAFSPDGR
jgi:polyvinyl alcohol dehydrogenase (cytochrome)